MSEVPEEEPDGPTSEEPPEEYEPEEVEEGTYGGDVGTADVDGRALVLKDCNPWMTTANESVLGSRGVTYDVRTSESLPDIDLDKYDVVVVPSGQSQEYVDRVVAEKENLAAFVESGGTLVAHVAHSAWICSTDWETTFLPGGVMPVKASGFFTSNELERLEPGHPIVSGLSDDDLSFWWSSTQGYLSALPDHATRVVGIQGDEARPTYVEYTYGNGVVLATMQTVEWPWQSSFGTRRLLRNDLAYAFEHDHGGGDRVSASVTALHYINGQNENFTQGGHPLHSSQMQLFRQNESIDVKIGSWGDWSEVSIDLPVDAVIDNWQKGDMEEELPVDLEEALELKPWKNEDEFLETEFKKYRFMNQIRVSFEKAGKIDGTPLIDWDTLEITFNERASTDDENVEFAGESESYTVLVDPDEGDVDDPKDAEINNLLGHGWFEEFDELRERGTRRPRYYTYEAVEIQGIPAVRISTISGVYAGFAHRIADLGTDGPEFFSTIWDWGIGGKLAQAAWLALPERVHELADALAIVPDIYSFLELFVLADGRRFVRVPDVSPFPGVSLYVDETRQWMRPVEYTPRERVNTQMSAFFAEAGTELAPYHAPAMKVYLHNLANLSPASEVTLGFEANGKPIDEPEEFLPFEFPRQFEERVPVDLE